MNFKKEIVQTCNEREDIVESVGVEHEKISAARSASA